jgi:hypothetical protein
MPHFSKEFLTIHTDSVLKKLILFVKGGELTKSGETSGEDGLKWAAVPGYGTAVSVHGGEAEPV